jgi:hypothetical protein
MATKKSQPGQSRPIAHALSRIFLFTILAVGCRPSLPGAEPLVTQAATSTAARPAGATPATTFALQPVTAVATRPSGATPAAAVESGQTATAEDGPAVTTSASAGWAEPQLEPAPTALPTELVLGHSAGGRPIFAYRFGHGPATLALVGGLHGGYEWNTILLGYAVEEYLATHPAAVPSSLTVWLIPSANPDGQYAVTGREGRFTAAQVAAETTPGRFNANGVDLNRNWECDWQPTALWRDQVISGGPAPFSEPESRALRDFFLATRPALVLFWHSAANGVYASGCPTLYPPARLLADVYGAASGYPVHDRFAAYPITGDAGDWLATQAIPSISVELSRHDALDWPQNLAGLLALLNHLDPAIK